MNNWNVLNWDKIEETVFKVQQAIYQASKTGDMATARNLQNYLINLYEAKYLAVKQVTQNSGAKTPGVDQWIAISDEDKFMVANNLVLDGNTNYIKRVFISKPGTTDMRPLGIPTIIDRCKQNLCKLALEPEYEAKFESNSFGFRPGRSAIDAISKIRAHLIFKGPCYVLDTDIRKCFDRINHKALLSYIGAIPAINTQIEAWLKAGILDKNEIVLPKEGTPQGGIISPLLANIALDGMQKVISDTIFQKFGSQVMKTTYFVRYADDFVVMGKDLAVIQEAKLACENFLRSRGLELKSEATRIINTLALYKNDNKCIVKSEYFDFLGFRFKQRYLGKHKFWKSGGKITNVRTMVLVNPARVERHKASIHKILKETGNAKKLIETLNYRIAGWCNYFKNSDARQIGDLPRKMDLWLNARIRKWIRRTSKLRGKASQFWKQDTKDWVLFHKEKDGSEIILEKYSNRKWSIYDYKAIESNFSPYQLSYNQYKMKRSERSGLIQSLK